VSSTRWSPSCSALPTSRVAAAPPPAASRPASSEPVIARPAASEPAIARVIDRSFRPMPVAAAYPTVRAGEDFVMTLRFEEGAEPDGQVVTRFVDDDGHGRLSISIAADRVEAGVWQARLSLPYPSRWEGVHEYHRQTEQGLVQARSDLFALRAVP
jgi:hypothetical protein